MAIDSQQRSLIGSLWFWSNVIQHQVSLFLGSVTLSLELITHMFANRRVWNSLTSVQSNTEALSASLVVNIFLISVVIVSFELSHCHLAWVDDCVSINIYKIYTIFSWHISFQHDKLAWEACISLHTPNRHLWDSVAWQESIGNYQCPTMPHAYSTWMLQHTLLFLII